MERHLLFTDKQEQQGILLAIRVAKTIRKIHWGPRTKRKGMSIFYHFMQCLTTVLNVKLKHAISS